MLQGCLRGVGLGVDDANIITHLRPNFPAALSGQMEVGDRLILP